MNKNKKGLTFGRVFLMMLAFITALFSLILLAFPIFIFKILGVLMFIGFILMGLTIIKIRDISDETIIIFYILTIIIIFILFGLGSNLI